MSKKPKKLKPIVVIKPHEEVVIAQLVADEPAQVDEPILSPPDPEPVFVRDTEQAKADSAAADNLATRAATESKDKSSSFNSTTIVTLVLLVVLIIAVLSLFEKNSDMETKLIAAQTDVIKLRAVVEQTSKVSTELGQYRIVKTELEQAQLDIAQLSADSKELKTELGVVKNEAAAAKPAEDSKLKEEVETIKAELTKMREQGVAAVTRIEKQLYRINRYFGWVE